MVNNPLLKLLSCPNCNGSLREADKAILCESCKSSFLVKNDKIFFIEPPKDAPKVLNLDPTNQKKWSNWRKANYQYFKEHLKDLPPTKVLLDLGAGFSQFRDLTKYFEGSLAVDFLPYELIDVVADLTKKLPFRDFSFDIILLSNVLEHIPNPDFLLKECFRILKPEGFVIGTVPFLMRVHQKPYDFHRFTDYMLDKLLKDAGFKKIEVQNLATTLDVYQTTQRHFFNYFLVTNFSENRVINFVLKFFARGIWQIQKLLMAVFSPLYRKCMTSPEYTQGYGFLGFK